jgi:putative ABC transport system ATP-binding protein
MIQLSNIQFQYPQSNFKLKIDSLQIEQGKKTAIIGPSGFGKTTLLNLLAGILQPDSGEITFEKESLNQYNDKKRRDFRIATIGFVFQDFRLIPYLNVLDNILLPYRINETLKINAACIALANQFAEKLGIDDKLKKYPDKLSQGERQRVAICRALIHQPKVILADEPTGNLDPENKKKIMNILFDYVKENKATLITVTHDYDMLEGFSQIIDFTKLKAS